MEKLDQENKKLLLNFLESSEYLKAENLSRELLKNYPKEELLLTVLGIALFNQNQLDKAYKIFEELLSSNPNSSESYFHIANILRKKNKIEQAIISYEKAIKINPNHINALHNLATTLASIGKTDESIKNYNKIIKIKPEYLEAYGNLAILLASNNKINESILIYKKMIELKPDHIKTLNNFGYLLKSIGRTEEAIDIYKKAFEFYYSDIRYAVNAYLLMPPITESINKIEFYRNKYLKGLKCLMQYRLNLYETGNIIIPQTFFLSYHGKDNLDIMKDTAKLFRNIMPDINYVSKNKLLIQKKIRIGFISQFLTMHTIGKLFGGYIKNLNKEKFEIIIFHTHQTKKSEMKNDIDSKSNKIINLDSKISEQQQQIEEENLDIIFYPDIGMSAITYFLAFSRLAPVQIVSWGHPETTGIDTIDYFLSSKFFETKVSKNNYSERLVCLDNFPIFYETPKCNLPLKSRSDLGIPENANLYGCPQSLYKIHPDFDEILSGILNKDPEGYLVFIGGENIMKYWIMSLRKRWSDKFPIINKRVIFTNRLSFDEFISLCNCVDVLLDPIHFGGGNTFLESMLVGTPTITMPTTHLRGNITYAAYKQMNILNPPIVYNNKDYIDLAVRLANNKEENAQLRDVSKRAAKDNLYENNNAIKEFEIFLEKAYFTNKSKVNFDESSIIKNEIT